MTAERYANLNRQKEVSDRLNRLRLADLATPGEDPATTLERKTSYIDQHVPIALRANQNDAAKDRFLHNATLGTTWAHHVKGRISASANYGRMAVALATSIHDEAELEEVLAQNIRNLRGSYHRLRIYKKSGRSKSAAENDEDDEP